MATHLRTIAFASIFASSAHAQATSVATHPDVLAQQRLFSAWLEGQLLYRDVPGVVVGVVHGDSLVWAKGFGYADTKRKAPMTPATKFRMASHSKLFTATAIMQLREQDKVRLDDPVSKHLSWFRVKPAADDDGPVTVEQLLTHSSGLPREANSHWTTYEFPTADEIRALIADRQAPFAPSVRWKYSNLAYTLAGMVAEQASGQSWAEYVQRNIFTPLGMTESSVDRKVEGLAIGYGRRMPDGTRQVMPFVDARAMGAATGITSTVGDMAKFVSAQFRKGTRGGQRILSSGSLREMHRVRSLENNWTSGNGIGFGVSRVNNVVYVGHGGSYPGYTTQTSIDLENKVGVIVLTNTNDSESGAIARQLMNSVGSAVAKAAAQKPKTVAWDPAWARFAGYYRSDWGDSRVVLLNEKLVLMTPNASSLDNVVTLEPIGEGRFRFMAATGGGSVGEIVRFVEEGGRVVRMYTGDGYAERIGN
ncbi:MAG TPA: serine hydrolase domain-containing protein [Gemmatimonadaceae bacterium]|nr:serine hydrolase domain-containing protein [Gemmatimonadaceae bacterium]